MNNLTVTSDGSQWIVWHILFRTLWMILKFFHTSMSSHPNNHVFNHIRWLNEECVSIYIYNFSSSFWEIFEQNINISSNGNVVYVMFFKESCDVSKAFRKLSYTYLFPVSLFSSYRKIDLSNLNRSIHFLKI